jgi:DNA-binding beta-propeller fold protein YncE
MRSKLAMAIFVFSVIGVAVTDAPSGATSNSSSNRDLLLVVNKGYRTLSIVDPESGSQLAAVPVGGTTGHEVAMSPDGQSAWVPIYGDSGVGSLGSDRRTMTLIDRVSSAVT